MKLFIFLLTFVGLTLALPFPIHDPEGKRLPNGLLPPEEAGKAGQKLAETFKTIIDSTADLILVYLNTNPQITEILESNPKIVEFILSVPEVVKYSFNHPFAQPKDVFPPEILPSIEIIFDIVGTDMSKILEKLVLSKDMKKEERISFVSHPTMKKLLSSPYIIEFLVNFPLHIYAIPVDGRRKLIKLLVENPEEGIKEIEKIQT